MSVAGPTPMLRALVLAPRGRDAAVAASLIDQAGVPSRICRDLAELVEALDDNAAFVLMTEEAIRNVDLQAARPNGWRASRHGPICPSSW